MLWTADGAADIAITSRLRSEIPSHPALRYTITHRRNTAGDLTDRVGAVQRFADDLRVVFIGLVSGQHVVVGGDDGNVVAQHALQEALSSGWQAANP